MENYLLLIRDMSSCKLFLCWATSGGGAQSKQTKQTISSQGELKMKSRCKKSKQLPTSVLRGRKNVSRWHVFDVYMKKKTSQFSQCVHSTDRQIVPFCPLRGRSLLVTRLSTPDFSWHHVMNRRVLVALWCGFIISQSICELFPYLLHLCGAETS